MSYCSIQHLSHRYGEKVLYQEAEFNLYKGEHCGIVGPNGTGKSTLLKILTGEVTPDHGEIRWQPSITIGTLDQQATLDERLTVSEYLKTAFEAELQIECRMNEAYQKACEESEPSEIWLKKAGQLQEQLNAVNFYDMDVKISRTISGLGLDQIGIEKQLSQLSGGQRTKVILAHLLLKDPEVLLLDEPTNYLDREHVLWLAEMLRNRPGAFLIVTHDFDFLQRIADQILDIEFGQMTKYHGTYDHFLRQKEHRRQDYLRRYEAQQQVIQKTEAYIRKNIAGVNTRIAQGRRKQLERMERLTPPGVQGQPQIEFPWTLCPDGILIETQDLEVGYEQPLFPPLNLTVRHGEKIVITGFNGVGKTTLLKTLIGEMPPLAGKVKKSETTRIAYYQQELHWDNPRSTAMELMSDRWPQMTLQEIRRALAACMIREDHAMQPLATLSGGEQSKAKLCLMLRISSNLLILDEPTQHFDADTKNALKRAIQNYPGAVLLVCHEADFYAEWAETVLRIDRRK